LQVKVLRLRNSAESFNTKFQHTANVVQASWRKDERYGKAEIYLNNFKAESVTAETDKESSIEP
jgi:hypothetical protein